MKAEDIKPITHEEAILDYMKLKTRHYCRFTRSFTGTRSTDHWLFKHRLLCPPHHSHLTFPEMLENESYKQRLYDLSKRYKGKEDIKSLFSTFQLYYGGVTQFLPAYAKFIYHRYKPRAILDPCAGWGGRLLSAMASGIPYIGIDTNADMIPDYEAMVSTLEPNANVRLFWRPAETADYSTFEYDMVFTSPPYWTLERYANMPAYATKKDFVEIFLRPVVKNTWAHLKEGGHMVLNMPDWMYKAVKEDLPPVLEVLNMSITKRPESHKGKQQGYDKMWVWRKE